MHFKCAPPDQVILIPDQVVLIQGQVVLIQGQALLTNNLCEESWFQVDQFFSDDLVLILGKRASRAHSMSAFLYSL